MKKWFILSLCMFLTGCASVEIPSYVQDENPYQKVFAASYDETLDIVGNVLASSGWNVIKATDPSAFELSRSTDDVNVKQTVLFTDVKQIGLFLGTRYARLNVYLQSNKEDSTEVEIRYITANSVGFKTFYNYKHDKAVERLFNSIEKKLASQE